MMCNTRNILCKNYSYPVVFYEIINGIEWCFNQFIRFAQGNATISGIIFRAPPKNLASGLVPRKANLDQSDLNRRKI